MPFTGFLAVRLLWVRRDAVPDALALAALTAAHGGVLRLAPARDRRHGLGEPRTSASASAASSSTTASSRGRRTCFSVVPELFGRSGAIAVAALLLLPLAALAARRRWAAYAVGGALAVFAITLLPWIFTPFSDAVSLSQSRRLAGFLPFGIALAGGIGVLARLIGPLVAPVALAGGDRACSSSIRATSATSSRTAARRGRRGSPSSAASWRSFVGFCGTAAARAPRGARHQCSCCAPTFVHGLTNWSPSPARPPEILSDGLIAAVRERVPTGAIVYADPQASYRLGAYAPVRVCVNPISHVADTVDNRPRERAREFLRFARAGDIEPPARRCGATWLVVDRERFGDPSPAFPVYRDARWALVRL